MTTYTPAKVRFERILVPTDFSDLSQKALNYAKSIARLNHSTLVLAHASEPANPVLPPEVVWYERITGQQLEEEQLDARAAELHSQGFRAKTVLLNGSVHDEILDSAEREDADLIVLGTHARIGLPRFLFGSEAEAMYRRANCPILVIGPKAREIPVFPLPNNDEPWHPRDILCACNLDPASASVAEYAYRLAQEHGANLTILHVDESEGKASKELQIYRFEQALRPLLAIGDKPFILWRTLMIGHSLGATISDLATERSSDLIVMGAVTTSHAKPHFPGRTTPQVLANAPCPVMILH